MEISFTKKAIDEYNSQGDQAKSKIKQLLELITTSPFSGIGKPEPLVGNLSGYWSRRINRADRLVYRISGTRPNQICTIIQCKYHY